MKRFSEEEFINDIFNIINEDKIENPKNLIQEDNFENKIIENNRLFVVDTENTNNYSFINNFKVNENDNIVLFFSNNSKSITIQTFENVNVGGKNALDFQLVAFITEKTIRGNFSEIHVISNDTGFNYAIDYINSCYEGNINLEIIQNINKNTSKGKKNNKTVKINKESEEKKAFEEVASEKEENSENNNLIFINNTEKELSQEDYDKNIVDEAIKNMVIDIDKKQLQFIHKSMKQCKTYKSFYNSITNSFRKDGDKIYKELIKYKKFNGEVI